MLKSKNLLRVVCSKKEEPPFFRWFSKIETNPVDVKQNSDAAVVNLNKSNAFTNSTTSFYTNGNDSSAKDPHAIKRDVDNESVCTNYIDLYNIH